MTRVDAIELARVGSTIRRDAWPLTKTLAFRPGLGERPCVAVLTLDGVISVLKGTDLTATDLDATDWRVV